MPQQTFEPSVSSTLGTAREIYNDNANDAESRLTELAAPPLLSKGSNYTIQPTDAGKTITSTSSSAMSFTITDSASFATGTTIEIVQEAEGTLTLAEGAGTTINRARFATLELGGRYSTVRLRKQSAGTWIASGDLKETQPRARFELDNQGPSASAGDLLSLSGVALQAEAPAAWQLEADGTATCLISGLYQFSGVVYIRYTATGINQNGVLGYTKNGSGSREFARGVRESDFNGAVITTTVYGWEKFAKGDIFSAYAPQAGTRIITTDVARQFWLTRISD